MELRDYQQSICDEATRIVMDEGFVYLSMEVRTGKTITALSIADKIGSELVLFVTKKKAISSIVSDYNELKPSFAICVINYESLHTIDPDMNWDLLICDEAHGMGAFPKPSNRALAIKSIVSKTKCKVILLSGTPTPESYSQIYHQVYSIPGNPFSKYKNFYRFCDDHVNVTQRPINGFQVKDYSRGRDSIMNLMQPYMISYTQQEAGFASVIEEKIYRVDLKESTYKLIDTLKKNLVIQGKEEVILADTPVKLMTKLHQLCSGTIKFESGSSMVIDDSKATFIHNNFCLNKIGIFYKFKEELNAIKQVYGDGITTELDEFNSTGKSIALQIVSGREGVSLKNADFIVYYNIDFSATSYWQSRDRMTTKDRLQNNVFWIFSNNGIEDDIYKAVSKKKDYTLSHFKRTIK
jgi:SNF2 family DNA or RNA helicase